MMPKTKCAFVTGSLRVEVPLRKLTARLNDNVTMPCNFSGFARLDLCVMGIRWYRIDPESKSKITVLELFGNNKNIPRTGAEVSLEGLQSGDASLELPAVQLGDAGEYWCEVVDTPAMEHDSILLEVLGECLRAEACSQPVLGPGVGCSWMWGRG